MLICLQTGGGKTVIAADILNRAVNKGYVPVFLTDRIEIAREAFKTLLNCDLKVQLVDASTKILFRSDCYVAMAETFYRRVMSGFFPMTKPYLIFCDECHMAVFNKIISKFTNAKICGLTATPYSSAFNLNKIYEDIAVGPPISQLIKDGYICPALDVGQRELLHFKTQNGEFTAQSQREAFSKNKVDETILNAWHHHAKSRSTIFFCIDVEHNQKVLSMLKSMGVTACAIDGKTPEQERLDLITDYNNGNIQALVNVGIATKGFDSPRTSAVVALFATQSLTKWRQVTGRGGRMFANKQNFVCIDGGNNILRHGSFNDDIDWEFIFRNPGIDLKPKDKRPTRLCNTCLAYIHNMYENECRVCGSKIIARELLKLEDQMPENLKDKPVKEMSLKELQTYGKYKGFKPGWAWFQHQNNQNKFRRKIAPPLPSFDD